MSFVLHVAAEKWRANADSVRDAVRAAVRPGPGDLVPVAKGNGYGLGNPCLAKEATRLGVGTLAVGTVAELADVAGHFPGDLLVLGPYEPADPFAAAHWSASTGPGLADRVLRTVSSVDALSAVLADAGPAAPVRLVLEALTSMRRFGLTADELTAAMAGPEVGAAIARGAVRLEGLALHLPLAQPDPSHRTDPGARWHDAGVAPVPPAGATARVQEVLAWAHLWVRLLADLGIPEVTPGGATGRPPGPAAIGSDPDPGAGAGPAAAVGPGGAAGLSSAGALWVSHLTDDELRVVRAAQPELTLNVRVGTRLWLGARSTLVARGTVLAVHPVRRGEHSGYQQRRALRDGALLVLGGGTAHGVALAAPSPVRSVRQRVVAAGSGVLEAGGWALSPFTVAGRQRWFAEPPHMQVSLVQLPAGVPPPAVGDEVDCDVRLTTAAFDQVVGLD